ncbi:MAG: hypothetical protein H7A03_10015 [Pseudomonadales bacterium]|nr:hypothetical protein [Pseudomonadales bacterium]
MPYEAHYSKADKHITYRYWGTLTAQEFLESFNEQAEFFQGLTGLVTVNADASDLDSLPTTLLTHARNSHLARYRPLMLVIVGGNPFVKVIANVFGKITNIEIHYTKTQSEAEQLFQKRRAQENRG